MKELSIEEKAKAYDEAIEKFDVILNLNTVKESGTIFADDVRKIFPELKESDESIIRDIRVVLESSATRIFKENGQMPVWYDRAVAWLEKQGEQKSDDIRTTGYWNVQEVEQNPANKVEPKFKVGDIIRHKEQGFTYKIAAVDTEYRLSDCNGTHLPIEWQDAYELVEQKPADKIVPKFKVGDEIKTSNEELLTITKIDEKGYWSDDLFICGFDNAAKWELVGQKPAWSEEDERIYKVVLELIDSYSKGTIGGYIIPPNVERYAKWFKSLKDRIQPKQEWSEEDRDYYDAIIAKLEVTQEDALLTGSQMEFLKSLKDRYTWRPSDEQMKALANACDGKILYLDYLNSLYNDLKKLKGE